VASKEDSIEMNAEKTKYMFVSFEQNGGQICNIKIGNKSFAMWIPDLEECDGLGMWRVWVRRGGV